MALHVAELDVPATLAGSCTSCGRPLHSPGLRPDVERIQLTVAAHYRIPLEQLLGTRRDRHIVVPRQVAMFLARALTDASLPALGLAFGGRDHTTVLHACARVRARLRDDTRLQADVQQLRHRLGGDDDVTAVTLGARA
jgi:chromosomal replication initiation ATPase DnaA